MRMIEILLAACAVLTVLFTLLCRRKERFADAQFVVKETPLTAVLGILLFAEAAFLCVLMERRGVTIDLSSAFGRNIAVFLAASALLGAFLFCYSLVRRVAVYADRLVFRSSFGSLFELRWEDVSAVKLTQTRRMKLANKEGAGFTVGGEKKGYSRFIVLASKLLPAQAGREIAQGLREQYKL